MMQRKGPDHGPKGRDHRPHHISSIAHHFLGEMGGGEAGVRGRQKDLLVCSASIGPLGAWVSAGLAKALGPLAVILTESPLLAWSATSYFPLECLERVDADDSLIQAQPGDQRLWRIVPPVSSSAPAGKKGADPTGADESQVVLKNIGTLNNRRLGELEAVHLVGNTSGSNLPGADVLAWCLTAEEAVTLGAAYTLGRALALFQPLQLEIIVVDEGFLDPRAGTVASSDPELLVRCRQLADAVPKSPPAFFSHVSSTPGPGSALPDDIFAAVGKRVLDFD